MRDDHNQDAVPFTLEPLRPELSYRKELLSPLSFTLPHPPLKPNSKSAYSACSDAA